MASLGSHPLVQELSRGAPASSRGPGSVRSMRGRPRSQGSSRSRLTVSKLPLAGLSSAASARSSARHVANKQRSVPVDTLGFEPRSALSRKLFSNYHMMQDMFAAADPGGRGVVTYRDFRTALAEIGVSLPKKEFNRILRLYDPSDSGVVDYRAFNKRLGKLFKPMANGQVFVAPFSEKKRGGKLVSGPPLTPTLAGRLETKVANQGVLLFHKLAPAFRARDPAETGQLSVEEFDAALRDAGIALTDDEERYIMQKFCVAGGKVPLDLFSSIVARDVKPKDVERAPNRLVTARTVNRLFAHKMFTRFRTVKRAFRIFDEDHSGDVSHTEFRTGLATLGFHMTDEEFKKFVVAYDKHNSGHVTFDQFNDAIGEFIQPRPTDGLVLQNRAPTPRLAAWVEPMFLQKALVMHELKQSQLSELFDVMDPYGAGAIPRARLVQAIRNVGIEGAESDWMAELYPADSNGRITKDVFVTRASEQVKLPGRPSFDKRPEMYKILKGTTQTADDVEKLFANAMFSRYRTVLSAFRQFDEDHNGVVSRAEFRAALASMGFHMTDHQFDNFFRLFDHNHSGAIDFEQFRETIGDVIQPTERRKHEVRPRSHQPGLHEWILRTMQKAVRSHFSDPTEVRAFVETCAGDDGFVSPGECIQFLAMFRISLGLQEEREFLVSLDRNESGKIPASELLKIMNDAMSIQKEQVARAPGSVMTSARSHGLLSSRSCSRSTPSLRPPLKLKTRVPPLANSKHRLPRPASSRSIPVPVSPLVSPSPSPSFRQRAEEIRTLQSQLEARGRAEMNLGNAASMSTIKALFSKMKRVDKRKRGVLPVAMFTRMLVKADVSLTHEDISSLLDQYGNDAGTHIDYVACMRQAFSCRATHRPPTASALQSARLMSRSRSRTGSLVE